MPTLAGAPIRGTPTYTSASGATPTAISLGRTIDPTKSLVFYTVRDAAGTEYRDQRHFWGYTLTDTTIQFVRNSASFAQSVTISYEIVEFTDVTVQHGNTAITSTTTNITVSTVDMDHAALFVVGLTSDLGSQFPAFAAELQSATNVRVHCNTSPGSGDLTVYWQVVEFGSDVEVQRGAVSLGSGVTTATGTVSIASVDTGRSVVIGGGQNEALAFSYKMAVTWTLTGATEITWTRAVYGSQVAKILPWQVLTFTNGATRHGTYTIAVSSTTPAAQPSFSALDPDKSSMIVGFPLCEVRATVDATTISPVAYGSGLFRTTIVPTVDFDGLTITRGASNDSATLAGSYMAVQWEGAGATQEETPTGLDATYEPGPQHVAVTLTWVSGGGSPTGYSWGFTSASGTPPSSTSSVGTAEATFNHAGSRSQWVGVRATGSLDPSDWAYYQLVLPDLETEPTESATLTAAELDTAEIDSNGASLGANGVVSWRALDSGGNEIGEDITIVVVDTLTAPVNQTVPTITGTARVGSDLGGSNGVWSPSADSYTYSWQRDGTPISGATSPTYTPVEDDLGAMLRRGVAGTNSAGTSAVAYSDAVGPILEAIDPGDLPAITIDGDPMEPTLVDIWTTETGDWRWYSLGAVSDGVAYVLTYDEDEDYFAVLISRNPGSTTAMLEQLYEVTFGEEEQDIRVWPMSIKVWESHEPVTPTAERLLAAIEAGRCVPFSNEFLNGWPDKPTTIELTPAFSGAHANLTLYRPDRTYGRSFSMNAIGIVGGQGGEYDSSRGFIDGMSAAAAIAAVEENSTVWNTVAPRLRSDMLYGLSLPYFSCMSTNHHQLRDPMLPLSGDTGYVQEGSPPSGYVYYQRDPTWTVPSGYPYLDEISASEGQLHGHGRRATHLFNHGYVYWLATGHPLAAILQQMIMAYMLASDYRGARDGNTKYRNRFNYGRWTINQFVAAWKLRDVMSNITRSTGNFGWSNTRMQKMIDDLWEDWEDRIEAQEASSNAEAQGKTAIFAIDELDVFSDYMYHQYGSEMAYLWATAGKPGILERFCKHLVLRILEIGGSRGMDRAGSYPHSYYTPQTTWVNDSTFFRFGAGINTKSGIIAAINSAFSGQPTTTYNGSAGHYLCRAWMNLKYGVDAAANYGMTPIADIATAITTLESQRDATTSWNHVGLTTSKHTAGLLPEVE